MLADDSEDAAGNAQAVREAGGESRLAPDGSRHLRRPLVLVPCLLVVRGFSWHSKAAISPARLHHADFPGT